MGRKGFLQNMLGRDWYKVPLMHTRLSIFFLPTPQNNYYSLFCFKFQQSIFQCSTFCGKHNNFSILHAPVFTVMLLIRGVNKMFSLTGPLIISPGFLGTTTQSHLFLFLFFFRNLFSRRHLWSRISGLGRKKISKIFWFELHGQWPLGPASPLAPNNSGLTS